jgi:hypothetical protein
MVHLQAALDSRALPAGGERTSAPVAPMLGYVLGGLARLLAPLGPGDPGADSRRPLAEWAPRLAELLDGIFRGQLGEGGDGSRDDAAVFERIAESLARLLSLPRAVDPPVPAHRAIRILLEDVRDEPLPEESEGTAVELLGWLELALDDAAFMIVTGFNDPFVPSSVTSHPFLPHGLREKIGLLGNGGRWARDLLALETMRRTRERLHIVTGRRSAAGDPLMPSRLLFAADAEVVARRVKELLSVDGFGPDTPAESGVELMRSGDPAAADHTFADEEAASFGMSLPPEPVLRAPAIPDRIRVTAFRELLTDPYAYALRKVLRLEPVTDEAREMDPLSFGNVAHAVLKQFGRSELVASMDAGEVGAALEAFLDKEARDRFGTRSLPAIRPQLGQLRARLRAFAGWQAHWVGQGWQVRAVEASPPSGGVPFEVDGSSIVLSGTIDRVDENVTTGVWCVLDYKTGDQRKDPDEIHRAGPKKSRRWIDLQLPLYRVLAASLERDDGGGLLVPRAALASLRLGYVQIPSAPSRTGEALATWTEAELAEAEEEARRAIRLLRENRFEFDPARSTIRREDALATVVGEGVLRLGALAAGSLDAGSLDAEKLAAGSLAAESLSE